MIYLIWCLVWGGGFLVGISFSSVLSDNKIRGLENQVKMRDDRVRELLESLGKFDIC